MMQVPVLKPAIRTLHVQDARAAIAIDTLQLEEDERGYKYMLVIVNMFTKFIHLAPVKDKTAQTTAMVILDYFCRYGLVTQIRTDPGSDFKSALVECLIKYLGVGHSFTLVDRPQADGVEGSNREVLRYMRVLCMDENVRHRWSDLDVYPIVQYTMNNTRHSETGYTPFELQYVGLHSGCFNLPVSANKVDKKPSLELVRHMAERLERLRGESLKFQTAKKHERENKSGSKVGKYTPGDFVLWLASKDKREAKLSCRNKGPYMVIEHISNTVTVESLIDCSRKKFDVGDLTMFCGTEAEAREEALRDDQQVLLKCIHAYKGVPEKRSESFFELEFTDGIREWQQYSTDIARTVQFDQFCKRSNYLRLYLSTVEANRTAEMQIKRQRITDVKPGDEVFINIRCLSEEWFLGLDLPNLLYTNFYVTARYGRLDHDKVQGIQLSYPGYGKKSMCVNNWFVHLHGQVRSLKDGDKHLTSEELESRGIVLDTVREGSDASRRRMQPGKENLL